VQKRRPKNVIVPLIAYLARYRTIKTVVFLVTDTLYKGRGTFPGLETEEGKKYIEAIKKAIEKCSPRWGAKYDKIWPNWPDLEREEFISDISKGVNNGLEFRFVRIGKFDDLYEIKRRLKRTFSGVRGEDSSKALFDITGGSAVISAAIILEAIKGDYRAGYVALPQDPLESGGSGCPVAERVEDIPISVFSFEDLANELRNYFERAYGRNK